MTNITIFKQNTVATTGDRAPSALGQTMAVGGGTHRRIQTNTNGTFKRLVNGEQIGNAVRGELDVIIVGALPKVSRVYYEAAYDPKAEAKAPDCWSNQGDKPEAGSGSPQSATCDTCQQNIKGSGDNGGRACRYQRRLAVLLAGDDSGDIYQLNVPAKSLFGKGTGNVHPFESYVKFLLANREGPDTVVTNVSYDLNAESMELKFTPLRNLDDDEYALVQSAQMQPEATNYTKITVYESSQKPAEAKAVEHKPEAKPKAKPQFTDEPDDDDVIEEPVKRTRGPNKERPAAGTLADKVTDLWGED